MDLATDIQTQADQIAEICNDVPPEFRHSALRGLDMIQTAVTRMKNRISDQYRELSKLRGDLADQHLVSAEAFDAVERLNHNADEITPAACIAALQSFIEPDTSIEIEASALWVHYAGSRHQATADDALDLLDAAGTLARAVRA